MTSKNDLPEVIVLKPNAAGLWLTYLIWLPTLTLCCVGFGINLTSKGLVPLNAERIATAVFGCGLMIGWCLLVRNTLRTISAFRFNVAARSVELAYPSGKRKSIKAEDIAYARAHPGSRRLPYHDGAKDRSLHLRASQHYYFPNLHMTGIKPEGFDRLMTIWNVPVQPVPREAVPDQSAHFTTKAGGSGVYLYKPRWGWILFCLVLALGFLAAAVSYLPDLWPNGGQWKWILLCCFMGLGSYAVLLPLLLHPIRAVLGPSHLVLGYFMRPGRRVAWSGIRGFAAGNVKVGRYDTLNPAIVLFLKNGPSILLASPLIDEVQHAPFEAFKVARLKAPRPFHLWDKAPAKPGK